MEGVTTALVGFIFVCVVYPQLVRNRPQYYAALAFVCAIILLDAVGMMVSTTAAAGFRVFAYAAVAFLQVGAILLLFLSAGGLSLRDLAGDVSSAIEVIRRGGEKTVIVPLTGAKPKPKADRGETPSERIVVNNPPARAADPDEKIPLE